MGDFLFVFFYTIFVNNSNSIGIYRKTIMILSKNKITQDDTCLDFKMSDGQIMHFIGKQ